MAQVLPPEERAVLGRPQIAKLGVRVGCGQGDPEEGAGVPSLDLNLGAPTNPDEMRIGGGVAEEFWEKDQTGKKRGFFLRRAIYPPVFLVLAEKLKAGC